MGGIPGAEPQIYKTKWFQRFVRKEKISDSALREAVVRAERGPMDADLFRKGERAVFIYGFAKNDRANISADEETQFKRAARYALPLTGAANE